MKLKYNSLAAYASLLAGMALVSCSNEEAIYEGVNTISVPVSTSITVPTPEVDNSTRTTLTENLGSLQWKWEAGDKVVAVDSEGNNIGYLTAGEPEESGIRAPFTGKLNFKEGATSEKISLFYLGKGVETASLQSKGELVIDLMNQDGKFESLVTRDVLSTQLNAAGKINVTINPNYTVIPNFELKHLTSAGHFQLQLKDGTTLNNVDVTISKGDGGNFTAKKTIKLVGLGSSQNANDVMTTATGENGDFYITLLPYSPISMKFVATYNGKEYTGYLGDSAEFYFTLTAGQYLRSNSNNFGPLVITMETDEPEVADHSKNPLAKWAKTNLDLSQTSGFAQNEYDRGQLFQFGRNCGYTDYKDARSRYAVYCSEDTSEPWKVWGFNVYNGKATGTKVTYSYSKTGTTDSNPDEYFWIADTDVAATNNDWWPQRASLGDNWETRASSEGWSKGDPSPDGWHIATTAEYNEIMPYQLSSTTLSNVFGKGEIRSNNDCTFAIKWDISKKTISTSNVRYVLTVRCLVVKSGTEYSDVDWSDENVIVRNFPAAGYINSGYQKLGMWYYGNNSGNINNYHTKDPAPGYSQFLGYQRNALPNPVGLVSYVPTKVNSSSVAIKYIVEEDHSNFRTSYWTSDGDCFGFSYDLDRQWTDPYFIGMHKSYQKTFAMPLRCVKD